MFYSLGDVITTKTSNPGLGRSIKAAIIIAKANEVSQGRWQAVRYRSGRLTIIASSPSAAQDLVLQKIALLRTINTALEKETVKYLTIRSS